MAQEELNILVKLKDLASKELTKIQSAVGKFGHFATSSFKSVTGAVFSFKGALAGLGVGLTVKGIADLIKGTADEADELRDLSIQLGTTTEFLSELKFAAGQAGIELNTLEIGLKTLQKGLGEIAATGGGEAAEAIHRLGPEMEALVESSASLEEKFLGLVKALKELPASERVFVASKLFGRGGGKILQFIEEDFDKASAAAKRFGTALSKEAGENADKFNDAVGELAGAFKGLKNQAILPLLPEIQKLVDALTDFVVTSKPQILKFFADFVEGAGEAGQAAKDLVEFVRNPLAGATKSSPEFLKHEIENLERLVGLAHPLGQEFKTLTGLLEVTKKELAEMEAAGEGAFRPIAAGAKVAADRIRLLADEVGFVGPKFEDAHLPVAAMLEMVRSKAGEATQSIKDLKEEAQFDMIQRSAIGDAVKLRVELERLEDPIVGARDAFKELSEASNDWVQATHDAILNVAASLTDNLTDGIMSLIDGTKSFKEAFRDTAKSILSDIARIIVQTLILKAVQGALGGIGGAFAKGAAFQGGNVVPMASGSIVAGPTMFPMSRGRTGLMGESGPEAVMPLKRINGRLGVESTGGGGATQVINLTVNYNGSVTAERDMLQRNAETLAALTAQKMRTSASYREGMRAA
jgi:tail tape-measure protein